MSIPRYFLFAYPMFYPSGGFHDLVFTSDSMFYPSGGFHDLVFTSDSIQDCKDYFEANLLEDERLDKEQYGDWYEGHIVDSELKMTPVLFVEVEYEKKMEAKPIKVTWSETYGGD